MSMKAPDVVMGRETALNLLGPTGDNALLEIGAVPGPEGHCGIVWLVSWEMIVEGCLEEMV